MKSLRKTRFIVDYSTSIPSNVSYKLKIKIIIGEYVMYYNIEEGLKEGIGQNTTLNVKGVGFS